jgi:hypothetical protein
VCCWYMKVEVIRTGSERILLQSFLREELKFESSKIMTIIIKQMYFQFFISVKE